MFNPNQFPMPGQPGAGPGGPFGPGANPAAMNMNMNMMAAGGVPPGMMQNMQHMAPNGQSKSSSPRCRHNRNGRCFVAN